MAKKSRPARLPTRMGSRFGRTLRQAAPLPRQAGLAMLWCCVERTYGKQVRGNPARTVRFQWFKGS
jgi:hypothetical protein